MAALVFAPPPWQFFAFPLVVPWQAHYDALAFYFPDLRFGLLEDKPDQEGFTTVLQPPRQKGLQTLKRDYHPGELSQWQAYLDFLATQEHQDETDLKAAIRGHLEPVLPKQVDRELLWSLAYQLEQMLSEEAAGLRRLAGQQQALAEVLGEDVGEAEELVPLDATLNPSLTGGVPDVALARVRYQFWRQVLDPASCSSLGCFGSGACGRGKFAPLSLANGRRRRWETLASQFYSAGLASSPRCDRR